MSDVDDAYAAGYEDGYKAAQSDDGRLGMREVADRIDTPIENLYSMRARGQLPEEDGTINGGRNKYWKQSTIDAWNRRRNET